MKNERLVLLRQAEKELRSAPKDVVKDLYSLIDDLLSGKTLSMPVSKPLFNIAKGLHELRLAGRYGQFRVFYVIDHCIYIIHGSPKKTQKLPKQTVDLILSRVRSLKL